MSSNTSPEKSEEVLQKNPDDEIAETEKPQQASTEQNLDSDYDMVSHLVGDELPEDAHIKQVLGYFMNHTYNASVTDPRVEVALDICIQLIEKDYIVIKIDNTKGMLSAYYPSKIPFIHSELFTQSIISESSCYDDELGELVCKAYRARCRQRFPVPVILYQGKTICRSSTLAGSAEVYGRLALDFVRPSSVPQPEGSIEAILSAEVSNEEESWKVINDLQVADIALLKHLRVGTIVDLMVENRKSKLGVPVTSSEKVDKDNKYHSTFNLLSLPFPGCEFFKEFHNHDYNPEGLRFDWDQGMCDAELTVPEFPGLDGLNIDWKNYKQWDLVQMTQNYIKYIIKYLHENHSGILIHCISGWDRTPLFISLLRMSLWADGVIHQSLSANEMLLLTLTYDWMLFGHHLADRLSKNEDILLYCFTILKYLVDEEYSVHPAKPKPIQPHYKTDLFRTLEEAVYMNRLYDVPQFSPVLSDFPEESNDSIDFRLDSPTFSICRESPHELESSAGPVPMEVCDGSCSNESESSSRVTPTDMAHCSHSRCETESVSSGGWQMVSATGSVRGSDCQSDVDTISSQGSNGTTSSDERVSRKMRLTQIRRLFYRCYYQTITDKHVNYKTNSTTLQGILNNLADIAQMLNQPRQ